MANSTGGSYLDRAHGSAYSSPGYGSSEKSERGSKGSDDEPQWKKQHKAYLDARDMATRECIQDGMAYHPYDKPNAKLARDHKR